jgi:hypothetical protein
LAKGPGPADYQIDAASARFRDSYPGAGGFSFGGGPSRAVSRGWRQEPREVAHREAHMKNSRSRSGGPFAQLRPSVVPSVLSPRTAGWEGRLRAAAVGGGGAGLDWGPEWD